MMFGRTKVVSAKFEKGKYHILFKKYPGWLGWLLGDLPSDVEYISTDSIYWFRNPGLKKCDVFTDNWLHGVYRDEGFRKQLSR
jgi:hypothetical protein